MKYLSKVFNLYFDEIASDYFCSPGRIELLGNHTDHNNGLVLVSSVSLSIKAATKKANEICIFSKGYPSIKIDLSNIEYKKSEEGTSTSLVKGILRGFVNQGYQIGGFKCYLESDIFKGAGISSSAAYELLIANILNYYYNQNKIPKVELAKIGQFAEVNYFGKPCGLLDQMGVSLGGINMIDFKSTSEPKIEQMYLELNDYDVILINTGDDHCNLTDYYKSIQDDMKDISTYFNCSSLREVKEDEFYHSLPILKEKYGGRAILRAVHYFEENKRVIKARDAIINNNIELFLKLINESGVSSFELLQNCFYPEDKKQGITLALTLSKRIVKDGAFRVHGGGFAGTILAFVNKKESDNYLNEMSKVFGLNNCVKVKLTKEGTKRLQDKL